MPKIIKVELDKSMYDSDDSKIAKLVAEKEELEKEMDDIEKEIEKKVGPLRKKLNKLWDRKYDIEKEITESSPVIIIAPPRKGN